MKFIEIKVTVLSDKSDKSDKSGELQPVTESYTVRRELPARWIPADVIPDMVDDVLALIRKPLVVFYTKNRN